MKKQLATLVLLSLTIATIQVPALAYVNLTFGHHDGYHSDRWYRRHGYYPQGRTVVISNPRNYRYQNQRYYAPQRYDRGYYY